MTYANSFDDFGAAPASAANGLKIKHTPWGMILNEPRIANSRFTEQVASAIVGGALIMAGIMMLFATTGNGIADFSGIKIGFTLFFVAVGAMVLRFSLESGVIETEIDLERRVIRICKVKPKRKVVEQIYLCNILDVLVVQTPEGAGLAVERANGMRADLIAVGSVYQIAGIHQKISDALPDTHKI